MFNKIKAARLGNILYFTSPPNFEGNLIELSEIRVWHHCLTDYNIIFYIIWYTYNMHGY